MNEILAALIEKAAGDYRSTANEPQLRKNLLQIAYNLPRYLPETQETATMPSNEIHHVARLFDETMQQLQKAQKKQTGILDVASGFSHFDKQLGGFMNGELAVIGARPGMGKTTFLMSLIENIASIQGIGVGFFALELNEKAVLLRLMAAFCNLQVLNVQRGNVSEQELQLLQRSIYKIAEMPLYINEGINLSISEMEEHSRHMVKEKNVKIIFLDNIQLLHADYGRASLQNRERELSHITRRLKHLAKELNVPVIITSQLNRSVETRGGDKRPHLSDLRETGALEQDADRVMFIYRPEYYGLTEDEYGNSVMGMAELVIAKNKLGVLTTLPFYVDRFFNRFYENGNELSNITISDSRMDDFDSF
jgi:replicative DNA helicase